MSHHKHSGGSTSRAETKRIDHKRSRAATRQALDGGHSRVVEGMNWGSRVPQPPLSDDPPRAARRKRGRWCKGHHGIEHTPVYQSSANWRSDGWRCQRCGKRLWGYRPPGQAQRVEHFSEQNIKARLAGLACGCPRCDPFGRLADHYSEENIRARLEGFPCRCALCCQPPPGPGVL